MNTRLPSVKPRGRASVPPLGKMYTGIVTGNIVTEGVPPHYQNVKRALDAGVVLDDLCTKVMKA